MQTYQNELEAVRARINDTRVKLASAEEKLNRLRDSIHEDPEMNTPCVWSTITWWRSEVDYLQEKLNHLLDKEEKLLRGRR